MTKEEWLKDAERDYDLRQAVYEAIEGAEGRRRELFVAVGGILYRAAVEQVAPLAEVEKAVRAMRGSAADDACRRV